MSDGTGVADATNEPSLFGRPVAAYSSDPMPPTEPSPGHDLLSLWKRLRSLPGGAWLFTRLLVLRVPYSGTTRPRVLALEPGRAEIRIRDRRRVRNHLGSIHAVALTNVGELASGLALLTALPPGVRGIVLELRTEFQKKARGDVTAVSRVEAPSVRSTLDLEVASELRDTEGDRVATVRALWRLERRGDKG